MGRLLGGYDFLFRKLQEYTIAKKYYVLEKAYFLLPK